MFIHIWRGYGALVIPITVFTFFATILATGLILGDRYDTEQVWPGTLGIFLSAALVWWLARTLDARQSYVGVDPDTGSEVLVRPGHSLYFIPMRLWPYVLAALGVVLFFR